MIRTISEKHFNTVVFVTLNMGKIGIIGVSVHHGSSIKIRNPTIITNDGVTLSPTQGSRFTVVPGFNCRITDFFHQLAVVCFSS